MAAQASGRRSVTEETQESRNRAGGECHTDGTNQEDSADKTAKWSREETEGSATDEEADTAGEAGGPRSARHEWRWRGYRKEAAWGSYQGVQQPAGATPGMSPPATEKAGVGGRHGEK